MTWSDASKIIFGAAIGLVISLLQSWYAFRKAQRRSERLLRVQIPSLIQSIESLKNVYDEHQIINTTELPDLKFFGGTELAALPDHLAELVLSLDDSIKRAEMSRKIAISNLHVPGSPEFLAHQRVYGEYIHYAMDRLNAIKTSLQCPESPPFPKSVFSIHRWFK